MPCHVCSEKFMTEEEKLNPTDVKHFHPCPIGEAIILRSFDKINHIGANYKETPNKSGTSN